MMRRKLLERKVFGNKLGSLGINPYAQPRSSLMTLVMTPPPRWLGKMARPFLMLSGQTYLHQNRQNQIPRPSSMSLGQIAKVLWGSYPKVLRALRRKRPGLLDVFGPPYREKRVTLSRSSSLEVARSPGIRRHPLPDQKANPRWLPPYCQGRRRPSQRPAVVPSSDDLQISQVTTYSFPNRKLHRDKSRIHQAPRCSYGLTLVMMGRTTMKVLVRVMIEYRALISPERGVRVAL
jgi:hypothetical protein